MECKICSKKTNVTIEINRVDYPICDKCCTTIFLHQANAYAKSQTIFDISKKKEKKSVKKYPEIAKRILTYLYGDLLKNDVNFDNKIPEGYLTLISNRINDGYTEDELKAVAYFKHKQWLNTEQSKFIRADTLFRPKNFSRYLSEVQIAFPKTKKVSTTEQKELIHKLNQYGTRGIVNEETDKLAKQLIELGYNNKDFLNIYLLKSI